jgi:hypothetical protein
LKARRRDSIKNVIDFSDYNHAVRHPTRLWDLAMPEELARDEGTAATNELVT